MSNNRRNTRRPAAQQSAQPEVEAPTLNPDFPDTGPNYKLAELLQAADAGEAGNPGDIPQGQALTAEVEPVDDAYEHIPVSDLPADEPTGDADEVDPEHLTRLAEVLEAEFTAEAEKIEPATLSQLAFEYVGEDGRFFYASDGAQVVRGELTRELLSGLFLAGLAIEMFAGYTEVYIQEVRDLARAIRDIPRDDVALYSDSGEVPGHMRPAPTIVAAKATEVEATEEASDDEN